MKTGDKIKCIDNFGYSDTLTVGKEYTVKSTYDDIVRVTCDKDYEYGFYQKRFEVVETKKVDKTNMKKGDKVKCVNPAYGLTLNKEYEVLDLDYDNDPFVINDQGNREMYYAYRFEVVPNAPTLKEQVDYALSLLGKKVFSGGDSLVVEKITIITDKDDAYNSTTSVYDYFKLHNFCVVVEDSDSASPVDGATIAPNSKTIELTDDYQAEVFKNEVKVGCQTISIEKVKEILTIAKSL